MLIVVKINAHSKSDTIAEQQPLCECLFTLALFVQIAFIYLFGNVHSNKNTWLGKALLPYTRKNKERTNDGRDIKTKITGDRRSECVCI